MKKCWILCMLLLFSVSVRAQVSVISVTDEDKHSVKEDFYHTFEYVIQPAGGGAAAKCQATRIHRRWFVTAAHCVYQKCDKGCTLEIDLLEQPYSVLVTARHAPLAKPRQESVFIHPDYTPKQVARNDIALIRLDITRAPKIFYRRPARSGAPKQTVSAAQFQRFLNTNRKAASQYAHVLRPEQPPLLLFDDMNYAIDRQISVISIFDGVRDVKKDSHSVYYLKDLGFAYTPDFGVRQGMSGSGVMTNAGELAGIISSSFIFDKPVAYSGDRRAKQQQVNNFFVFPVFNKYLQTFLKDTMGSDYYQLDFKDAPRSWKDNSTKHDVIQKIVQAQQRQAGGKK